MRRSRKKEANPIGSNATPTTVGMAPKKTIKKLAVKKKKFTKASKRRSKKAKYKRK